MRNVQEAVFMLMYSVIVLPLFSNENDIFCCDSILTLEMVVDKVNKFIEILISNETTA